VPRRKKEGVLPSGKVDRLRLLSGCGKIPKSSWVGTIKVKKEKVKGIGTQRTLKKCFYKK